METMTVLINRFEVHGSLEEFEKVLGATAGYFRHQPGFLRFRLVRSMEHQNQYVNIAEWENADSLRTALSRPEFAPYSAALRAVATSSPAMHEPVYEALQPVS